MVSRGNLVLPSGFVDYDIASNVPPSGTGKDCGVLT
jgi:hypothetical protein